MSNLRAAVLAWCAAEKKADAIYKETHTEINRELDAIGGYATTSPQRGLCRSFYRMEDGFGGGVDREGEQYGGTGPNADTIAPHHPDVGDRCFALELAHRTVALEANAARKKVEEIAVELLKGLPAGVTPEALSAAVKALVLSDEEA